MYSVVLMMALSNGAAAPAHDTSVSPIHSTGHYAYRGGHGCCGCNGGGHRGGHGCCGCNGGGHRGGRHHGCCGYNSCCNPCNTCCNVCCNPCDGGGHGHGTPAPAPAKMPAKDGKKTALNADTDSAQVEAPATIIVELPADASLRVDDEPTASDSSIRTLVTPALDQGEYYYTLTAEVVRDGQQLTTSKRVAARGGEETRVQIDFATSSVAQR